MRSPMLGLFVGCVLSIFAGCQPTNQPGSEKGKETIPKVGSSKKSEPETSSGIAELNSPSSQSEEIAQPWIKPEGLPIDRWEIQYVNNTPVGTIQQKGVKTETNYRTTVQCELHSAMRISRQGQAMEQKVDIVTDEEINGELNRIQVMIQLGGSKTKMDGLVNGEVLRLEIEKDGSKQSKTLNWNKALRGPFAIEQSLRRKPMEMGETRTIRYLDPILAEMVETDLKTIAPLKTPLLDGSIVELLEIESITRFGKTSLRNILWIDGRGEIHKSYLALLDLLSFRCQEKEAKSVKSLGELDLMPLSTVALDRSIDRPEAASRIKFRIKLAKDDPVDVFSNRTNQSLRSLIFRDAELIVHRIGEEGTLPEGIQKEDPPGDVYLKANSEIQSDDQEVLRLAQKLEEQGREGESLAIRLQRGVYEAISKKDMSKSFSSAAQVARELQGDCTEHAVLLAAVARAKKIPSRLACGLVYVPSKEKPSMAYHMWTELWIKDRWVPFDATQKEFPIPPTRIKVMETTIEDGNPALALLQVLRTMGELTVEVDAVE